MPYNTKKANSTMESKSDDMSDLKLSINFICETLEELHQIKPEIQHILKLVTKLRSAIEQKDEQIRKF